MQNDILKAWREFVTKSVLLKDKVRPEIAKSWKTCKELGLDPWSSTYPVTGKDEMKVRIEKNRKYGDSAHDVMQMVHTILDVNISINDADYFVFKLFSSLDNYPRTIGSFVTEECVGTSAISLCLQEHRSFRTDGYEHYRAISHACSDAAAPVFFQNKLLGSINAVSLFGPLPESTLAVLEVAAKLIENRMYYGRYTVEDMKLFVDIIEISKKNIVVYTPEGEVKYVSRSMEGNLAGITNLNKYFKSCQEKSLLFNVAERPGVLRFGDNAFNLLRKCAVSYNEESVVYLAVFDEQDVEQADKEGAEPFLYIGKSPVWQTVDFMVHKVAAFPSNILLSGETGTGKEVVAKALHTLSGRKGKFVAINCGNIPKELMYSEFFGYEKGAFTGARAEGAIGKFEFADKGTLFLDEIGEMPLDMQVSLLRFVQEKTITKINSTLSKSVDVRIVAATNRDLKDMVRKGQFRADLYYRLSIIEVKLPPLRYRGGDVILLAEYFIKVLSRQTGIERKVLADDAKRMLLEYGWPGNVRELRNCMEKAMILSDGDITRETFEHYSIIESDVVPDSVGKEPSVHASGNISEYERIAQAIEKHGSNMSKAAKELGIARNTLYRKIKKYNIKIKTSII